ncbi:MAG: 3-deoxy-manno-octulosonate cytidylyltransferase, partial [Bacteroidales bacterium]|nr:3-deoxy-manno-octulosonate cytidylyltransferase [Bacteroidales bacterium]
MTSRFHKSGTERVAEVANRARADVVVNIQGDEPFLKASMIDSLIKEFKKKDVWMATLATKINNSADLDNPSIVKVVFDKDNYALYFSRSRIPYLRDKTQGTRHRY